VSSDGWAQYAEYARRLDAVRAEEQARTAGMREGVAEMSAHADDLQARLNGQGGMLTNLATILQLRRPKLTPIEPEGFVDPSTELGQVARAIDLGDQEARRADVRGHQAALLPAMSGLLRSLVVYGSAAALVLLLQALEFLRAGKDTNGFAVLFVIPLLGFVVGFVVLALGSRVRVTELPETSASGIVNRTQAAQLAARKAAAAPRTRLGALLCFGIGPLALIVVLAASVKSK
jgi:hypothetical protein